jgi:predicted dehydrogenase
MSEPKTIGIVGNGWRAQFFQRSAAALPGSLRVAGVATHSARTAETVARDWHQPTFGSVAELVRAEHPDFLIVSVPRDVAPALIEESVELGIPVLTETPPAPDLAGLVALWERVGASGLVQVAEQYRMMPGHAARLELLARGIIGERTSAHVSSTHDYHGISMIRGFLGVGLEPADVNAHSFTAPLADPLHRDGWTDDDTPKPAANLIATVDFGGAMGLYDFTDNQWHNQLRSRRVLVRGTVGELSNDAVVRLAPGHTYVHSSITRRQIGYDLDLDGYDTDHLSFDGTVLWRNPFAGSRFSDEEVAIATLLTRMGAFARGDGPAPYSLAEGSQDHAIALAMHESVHTGTTVHVPRQPWADRG